MELARRLVEIGVDMLICGGIQRTCKEWLTGRGVRVVDNQKGQADDLVMKFMRKEQRVKKSSCGYDEEDKSCFGKK